MTGIQRIKEILFGIVMIFGAYVMMTVPKESYPLVILILALWFVINGISTIWYYLTMARFMVGGKTSLYMGVIMLDFGIITISLTGIPHYYVLMYLVGIHGFYGAVSVLRTIEAKKNGASKWKMKLVHGIIDILLAIVCVIFMRNLSITVIIYSIGIMYSAVMRIISACRRTELVIIE